MVDHSIFRLHRGAAASLVVDGQKNAQTSEIFNPVTAAGGPEMSADAHLGGAPAPMNHATMPAMDHSNMPGMNHDSAPAKAGTPAMDRSQHAMPNGDTPAPGGGSSITETIHTWGIPPASDDKAMAAARERAAAAPKQDAEPAPAAPGNTVSIMAGAGNYGSGTNAYGPDVMTVKRGTAVTWVNNDPGMVHNVAGVGGTFTSTLLREGQSWTHVFSKPGTYPYTCLPHPWMRGTLIVK
jgi:plastocyanin